jgi:MerR family transcriptional regulator/heat shock protein HspR
MNSRRDTTSSRWQSGFPLIPSQAATRSARKKIIPSTRGRAHDQSISRHIEGVYVISVASRILAMHPQTLRKYERLGLVNPSRTEGMLRLYSERDIARLRMIKELVEIQRMNLAGVEMALSVINRLLEIRQLVHDLVDVEEDARERIHREMEGMMNLLGFVLPPNSLE